MEFKKVVWRAFKGSFLPLLLFLIACPGMQKTVTPEDRISLLNGGPHSGNCESRTILLDYQYYKHSGEIKFYSGGFRRGTFQKSQLVLPPPSMTVPL